MVIKGKKHQNVLPVLVEVNFRPSSSEDSARLRRVYELLFKSIPQHAGVKRNGDDDGTSHH